MYSPRESLSDPNELWAILLLPYNSLPALESGCRGSLYAVPRRIRTRDPFSEGSRYSRIISE